ncbi:DinB family protein [Sphaerobacter thermophilus]|nr:DinB family protein [Sphaerobacter thermophilus]
MQSGVEETMGERVEGSEVQRLRAEVVRAHDRFTALVAGIDPVVLETNPAVGSWSVRDVTGHLADWHREMLDAAEHILGGPKPRHHPIKHTQSFNTMSAAVRGTEPWEQVAADLEAARDRALAFLDRLTPEQLGAIGPFPWGEVGRLHRLIEEMVEHVDEHAAQVGEWRLRLG